MKLLIQKASQLTQGLLFEKLNGRSNHSNSFLKVGVPKQ